MLKAIERLTKQRIAVEKVPTVADLRARRLELTRAALREILLTDDIGQYGVVVETLTDEFDLMNVALAAVKLAHEATTGPGDEAEIPDPATARGKRASARDHSRDRDGWRGRDRAIGNTCIFLGVGRNAGVRPQDLVGAITGESRLAGRDIGAIEIAERFSLVEVPEPAVEEVIAALRNTTIKGKKARVRRERDAVSGGASRVGGDKRRRRGAGGS